MEKDSHYDMVVVGLDHGLMDTVDPVLSSLSLRKLRKAEEIAEFLDGNQLAVGTTVIVSTSTDGMSHMEIGQAFSSYYQGINLIFVTKDRAIFETATLKKNGFTDTFLLPADDMTFKKYLENLKNSKLGGVQRRYKAIKLVDLHEDEDLPFQVHVFMPLNRKYSLLTASGKMSQKKYEKLKQSCINSVFVEQAQMSKFYDFSAQKLIALAESGCEKTAALSETERSEKLQTSVRQLFRTVLSRDGESSFESGSGLMEQSKKIVDSYVKAKTGLDLNQQLKRVMGEADDSYSHAQAVSTIAALMSLGTGIGKPEDLAIAGLFHDLGVEGPLAETNPFTAPDLSSEEFNSFKQHPLQAVTLLREKKVIVTPEIAEIIEKHHERVDGKGFPNNLPPHKIPLAAQMLTYADVFEYLSRRKEGQAALSPAEIHEKIAAEMGLSNEVLVPLKKFIL